MYIATLQHIIYRHVYYKLCIINALSSLGLHSYLVKINVNVLTILASYILAKAIN